MKKIAMVGRRIALGSVLCALLACDALGLDAPVPCEGCVPFPPTTSPWQWQLEEAVDPSVEADVYDIDGELNGADVV